MIEESQHTTAYLEVLNITEAYVGPAAERFIARQVWYHLHKAPEMLTATDLPLLLDWMRIAMSLLTEDSRIVEEYIAKLRALIDTAKG